MIYDNLLMLANSDRTIYERAEEEEEQEEKALDYTNIQRQPG